MLKVIVPPSTTVANDPAQKGRVRWNAIFDDLRAIPGRIGEARCSVSMRRPQDEDVAKMKALGYPRKLITFNTKNWFRCMTLRWHAETTRGEAWGACLTDEGLGLVGREPLALYEQFAGERAFPASAVTKDEFGNRRDLLSMDGYLPGDASVHHFSGPGKPPLRLRLDQTGYFETMWLSRGYLGWQRAIDTASRGEIDELTERFRADMSELFSWFDWDVYVATYQARRIK